MAETPQLLATKLYIPTVRASLVERPHLVRLIEQGLGCKLVLISAPAGFGKTTLVTEWSRRSRLNRHLAWLSLDEGDNDPVRFLGYLLAALRGFCSDGGESAERRLYSPQPFSPEAVLTALINALAGYISQEQPEGLALVLDDYHLIDNEIIHRALAFLLEKMPPQMHLIITSRHDPLLPLHRLRARCELTELRAADLRFNDLEVAEFISSATGQQLDPDLLEQLTVQTEGWVTGLQLAALSLKGNSDSARFIRAFSASNRFILEYLAEEVLHRQPERVRRFLLQTSILEKFNRELAEAVTGQPWSEAEVSGLAQANLFLVALDDNEEWYRYHHLFREFLQHQLGQEAAEQIAALHGRAGQWFEQHGQLPAAISHYLAAPDYPRAITLLEQTGWTMLTGADYARLDEWLAKLPPALLTERPRLALYSAWLVLLKGQPLTAAEKLLATAEQAWQVENNRAWLGEVYHLRAQFSWLAGDLAATQANAQAALELLLAENLSSQSGVRLALAGAYCEVGEVTQALPLALQSLDLARQGQTLLGQLGALYTLAEIYAAQGRLPQAEAAYREAFKLFPQRPAEPLASYNGLARLYLEWNEPGLAWSYLDSFERLEAGHNERLRPDQQLLRAKLYRLQERPAEAQAALDYYQTAPIPRRLAAEVTALRQWWQLKDGALATVEEWWTAQTPDSQPALTYADEPLGLALARLRIWQGCPALAVPLLEGLADLARRQGRVHSLIQILLLLAQSRYGQASLTETQANLEQALELAEPGGYLRIFLDEGPVLATLLTQLESSSPAVQSYRDRLLELFQGQTAAPAFTPTPAESDQPEPELRPETPLLSERELEVLRLIAAGASNQEIADRLVITLSTVKKHATSIFSKLEVTNRTQALLRARELQLSLDGLAQLPASGLPTTTLTVWTIGLKDNPAFARYIREVFGAYQKRQPQLDIKWEDFVGEDIQEHLLQATEAGRCPDLVNFNTNFALKFATNGLLEDIGSLLSPADRQRYVPTVYEATRIGEAIYGLPWYVTVPIMMINRELFSQAGFDPTRPPRTFEEAIKVAQAIQSRTGHHAFQPITSFYEDALMEGFPILSPDKRRAAFNTPQAAAKLDFYETLRQARLIPNQGLYEQYESAYEEAVRRFKEGRLAMLLAGGSLLSQVEKDAPQVYRNTIVAPHLVGKSGMLPAQMMNFVIPKAARHKQAALELALYLTSDPNQLAFDKLAVILPSTVKASQDRLFELPGDAKQEARRIMARQLRVARDGTVNIQNYVKLNQVLNDHLTDWWRTGKPSYQALAEASHAWNTLLAKEL